MKVFEAWVESGTDIVRAATDEEKSQKLLDEGVSQEFLQEMIEREQAKRSAIAKFRILGLTDEEIAALVGVSISDIEPK